MFSAVSSPVHRLFLQPHLMILLFHVSHVTSPVMSLAKGHNLRLSTPSSPTLSPIIPYTYAPRTSQPWGVVFIGLCSWVSTAALATLNKQQRDSFELLPRDNGSQRSWVLGAEREKGG